MIVVSNTSPLCYLLLIDQIELLPDLFGEVNIPEGVRAELSHADAPIKIREWIAAPPAWVKMHSVIVEDEPELSQLHTGERESIALAHQLSADLIILDEKRAREIAKDRGLEVVGLLGILDTAAYRGMVDLKTAVERLSQTNFRAAPALLKWLLDRH